MLFIDASREFKAGKNQNQLSEENIEKIVKTYRNGDNVEKYAYLASLKEIQDNDYNLNIPRYVDTFEEEDEIDLLAVRAETRATEGGIGEAGNGDGWIFEGVGLWLVIRFTQ